MPTYLDKDELVPLLRREFDAVIDLCGELDGAAWETPTCLPGWTVKDQLSHLVGTESMLDGVPTPDVDVDHLDHVNNDIGRFNELWVEWLRPTPGREVLARFRDIAARRLAALEEMSQEEFDAPSFTPVGRDETYGRFMRIRLYDCYLHEHDMREALGVEDRPDPQQLHAVLDEMAATLGYVIGRKAAIPSGSTVRIRVSGTVERDLDYEVGDRAEPVDHIEGEPTVTLLVSDLLLVRLAGGRTDPTDHLGEGVTFEGDDELARRLAVNLAHTI